MAARWYQRATRRTVGRALGAAALAMLALLLLTLALPIEEWRTGRQPVPSLPLMPGDSFAEPARRVWIDTDAACGEGHRTDPDDCFAILLLAAGSEAQVAGVSTSFGNAPLRQTDRTARALVAMLPGPGAPAVHTGRAEPLGSPDPVGRAMGDALSWEALPAALAEGPLTIVALGPLTNIAAAFHANPSLRSGITRLIAVMGNRPGHVFHPTEGRPGGFLFGHGPVFRDLNLAADAGAAAEIVRLGVPLVLVPYDAARRVEVTRADLDRMRARGGAWAWVADRARGWLDVWREDVGWEGFYPFDLVGAAFALRPDLFRCAEVPVRVGADEKLGGPLGGRTALLAGPDPSPDDGEAAEPLARGAAVYCPEVADGLRAWLRDRLGGAG
jgi:purine nucleosidase